MSATDSSATAEVKNPTNETLDCSALPCPFSDTVQLKVTCNNTSTTVPTGTVDATLNTLTPDASPQSSRVLGTTSNGDALQSSQITNSTMDSAKLTVSTTRKDGDIMETLPIIMYVPNKQRKYYKDVVEVKDDPKEFLEQDLDTSRLNAIHGILWMAGRPLNARPLHRHIMMDMRILKTEQADMHILKVSDRLFVKPLPAYLLSSDFWKQYLCGDPQSEKDVAIHKRACGLLLSYIWLIQSEMDMKIAQEESLVPRDVSWTWWRAFVQNLLDVNQPGHLDPNSLAQVDKRYQYGEIRLSRVNSIYRLRFAHTHFIRGYLYGYNRYVVFFKRNFEWMLVIFVYFSLVLSAMQVGVSVPPLQENYAFQRASYGFVVFSIVLVAAVVGVVGILFIGIFTVNTILSVNHSITQRQERKKLAGGKKV